MKSYLSYIAIGISISALFFTIRRFLLKSGTKIQGIYTISSSVNCDDKWVSKIFLENLKDRATTIYSIYLKVGYGCYLELIDFHDNPLILKAFESYQNEFDAIEYYEFSTKKIKIDKLIGDKKVKKTICLSTANGIYKVKKPLRRWNPIVLFFKNHLTAIVRPVRLNHKGKSYGANICYLVELSFSDGNEQTIPIHKKEYTWNSYKEFKITKECLESKNKLQEFFNDLIDLNKINASSVTVYDLKEWRQKNESDFHHEKIITLKKHSWYQYYIIGYLGTYLDDRKRRKENKNRLDKRKKSSKNDT